MQTRTNKEDALLDLINRRGLIRTAEVVEQGFAYVHLSRLVQKGMIRRVGRGLYEPLELRSLSEHYSLAEAAKAIPGGVICLLSALVYHGIGTQMPSQVWIAIDRYRRKPRVAALPIRLVWLSEPLLKTGIATLEIDGIPVLITTPARTVADCFKFRNEIGLDVALEALREGLHERKFTRNELVTEAKMCRVWTVLRPYLEATS